MFTRLQRSVSSHPVAADLLLVIVLVALVGLMAVVQIPSEISTARVVSWVLFALAALPLAIRRQHPYVCVTATLALIIGGSIVSTPFPPVSLSAVVALYTVGTVARGRSVGLVVVGALAFAIGMGFASREDGGLVRSLALTIAWAIGPLALGAAVANWRAYLKEMRQRAIEAERTKEEEAERRVGEERMRIARDVHDSVAHALASISIQASAGMAVLDNDPKAVCQVLTDIRAASRSALSELRSTLELLRHGEDRVEAEGIDREQAERLAAVLHAGGIRVRVGGDAAAWVVGGERGAALYRILQESLTNVLRHSGATEVQVALDRTERDVVLTVVDNGRGAGSAETRGHGIAGMRERASLLGGRVESGPSREGGFRVRVELPLREGS